MADYIIIFSLCYYISKSVMKRRDPILINLGSGPNGIDGWVNYDWGVLPLLGKFPLLRNLMIKIKLLPSNYAISWPKIRLHDLRKRLPMNDNSVDFIYCSHVMEHFENMKQRHCCENVKGC